ncbi:hypothetical protein M422DRAFT_242700 [Sphaerobolus stellatus SS14]|nr:hypothetical protein M422DRAFT_242700 [Sphaerobolus stellatus SS14]
MQSETVKIAPVIDSGSDNTLYCPVSNGLSILGQTLFPILNSLNNDSPSPGHPATAVDYQSQSPTAGGRVYHGEAARDISDLFSPSHPTYTRIAKFHGMSDFPVLTGIDPPTDSASNNDKMSIIIHFTTKCLNLLPDILSAPCKAHVSYRHNDGFSISHCTASPMSSISKAGMTGSNFFNDWFENSDNETITGDEIAVDYIPQNASPLSTSIETQPIKRESDKSYKKFMSGILEEMPTPEHDLAQRRAVHINRDYHRCSVSKIHGHKSITKLLHSLRIL